MPELASRSGLHGPLVHAAGEMVQAVGEEAARFFVLLGEMIRVLGARWWGLDRAQCHSLMTGVCARWFGLERVVPASAQVDEARALANGGDDAEARAASAQLVQLARTLAPIDMSVDVVDTARHRPSRAAPFSKTRSRRTRQPGTTD